MEILWMRVDRAVAPAAVLVERVSPRAGRSEHWRGAALDGVQICREAEDRLPVVEADRGEIAPDCEHVALLPATAETLKQGAVAAADAEVCHVTRSTKR
jgi:hypothetical protein